MSEIVLMSNLTLGLSVLAFMVLVSVQLLKKAGYSPWLGLLALIPGVALFLIVYLSLAAWPVEKKLRFFDLRRNMPTKPVKKAVPTVEWNVPAKDLRKGDLFARQASIGW